ncbi:helix-turn-helix domain-containing protein [Streptomyces sp. SID8016]|uniref:helix-turn-helix domain-containing protein n=1 Tax=Streptomyces sp. SID8016 TaxID=2706098 RepID=UPI0013DAF76E|nr:helix-turn-helix domain-containing protein [Streptomyces sp. SID8016]
MPERSEPPREEGVRELMNMSKLAEALGVTRQWLHKLRVSDPEFPAAERAPGSTRDVWDLRAFRVYYEGREKRPGERTDLKSKE